MTLHSGFPFLEVDCVPAWRSCKPGDFMGTDLSSKGAKLMECDAELSTGNCLCPVTHLRKGVRLMENRGTFLPREGPGLESSFPEHV